MSRLLAWTTTVGVEAALRPLVWVTGPVFEKELRVAARRRRNFVLRTAYLVALTLFVLLVWVSQVGYVDPVRSLVARAMTPAVGRAIVREVLTFQFILLPLLAAIMLGGSMSEEIRSRTLATLMVTPVGSFRIVLGKLLSRLLQLGLLMAVSLPLLVVVRAMGGVDLQTVILGLAVTATMCLFIGAIGLLLSTFFQTAVTAVIVILCMLAGLYFLQAAFWTPFLPRPGAMHGLFWFARMLDPYAVFWYAVSDVQWTGLRAATLMSPILLCIVHCGAMLVFTACALVWAAQRVRQVGLRLAMGDTRAASRWEGLMRPRAARRGDASAALRPITGSPILWRERQVRFGPSRFASVGLWAIIAGTAAALDIGAAWGHQWRELVLVGFVANNVFLFCAGILLTVLLAAPSLSAEKEGRTLGILLATPMSERSIIGAKALGAMTRALPIWGLLAVHVMVYVLLGMVQPAVVSYVFPLAIGMAAMFTGTGLYFAARVRRTSAAVGLNLGLALALLVGPVLAIGWLPRGWTGLNLGHLALTSNPVFQVYYFSAWAVPPPGYYSLPSVLGWDLAASPWTPLLDVVVVMAVTVAAGLFFGDRAARRLRRGVA